MSALEWMMRNGFSFSTFEIKSRQYSICYTEFEFCSCCYDWTLNMNGNHWTLREWNWELSKLVQYESIQHRRSHEGTIQSVATKTWLVSWLMSRWPNLMFKCAIHFSGEQSYLFTIFICNKWWDEAFIFIYPPNVVIVI